MRNSRAEAERWLRQAENDLAAGQLMLREGFYSQACFIAHQVVEKALKALAYFRGDRHVIGHSLMDLASSLAAAYPQVAEFQELAGILDQYYVPTRYPDALPGSVPFESYNMRQAREAIDGAAQVVSMARNLIER